MLDKIKSEIICQLELLFASATIHMAENKGSVEYREDLLKIANLAKMLGIQTELVTLNLAKGTEKTQVI